VIKIKRLADILNEEFDKRKLTISEKQKIIIRLPIIEKYNLNYYANKYGEDTEEYGRALVKDTMAIVLP